MKRIVIIDDEADARQLLRLMIERLNLDIEVIGEADGIATGSQLIRQLRPDAVLLDISMKDGTGFDLLDRFPAFDFQVVFTTAHDQFDLRAFRYDATDFLLKPIQPKELIRAIKRIVGIPPPLLHHDNARLWLDNARHHVPNSLILQTQEGLILLKLHQILYLEAENSYTTFFLEGGDKQVVSRPIGEFEAHLPIETFFRIHQSYLVNLEAVRKIIKEEGNIVVMNNGVRLPLARRRKDEFLAATRRFVGQ